MRTEQQYLDEYAVSHQNPTNQVIHMICVPAIFAATLALLWFVPVGRFLSFVPADVAPYVNLATIGLPFTLLFYATLSMRAVLVGAAWTAITYALILAGVRAELPVAWLAAAIWIAAWAVQAYGHKVEGAKPSFLDDLVFLLIGPLFVQQKFNRLATTGSYRAQAH